jgi:hypothetical protein
MRMETDTASEMLFFLNIRQRTNSRNSLILNPDRNIRTEPVSFIIIKLRTISVALPLAAVICDV